MSTEERPIDSLSCELGAYRPPSEAYSLLLRLTRNCPWNRCRFCEMYKGQKFEIRTIAEIKQDILTVKQIHDEIIAFSRTCGTEHNVRKAAASILNDPPNETYQNVALWLYKGGENVFLQDANSLVMRTEDMVEILTFLKQTLPSINRITSYCRAKTAALKKQEELNALHLAGLTRLHIGLESGSDTVLKMIDKGTTPSEEIVGGKKVVAAGISLSEYYLLGIGGSALWREHALESARVLNEINPDYIRLRTLSLNERLLLWQEVENGFFVRTTDEEMLDELKLFIENLDCAARFASDHVWNLLPEIEGKLPEAKAKMLDVIARFQALSPGERQIYRVGRRAHYYNSLDDLKDPAVHQVVEQLINELSRGTGLSTCTGCKMNNPASEIINIMRTKKLTLGTVESASGGLIAGLITDIPGSSDVFKGAVISYSNEIKMKLVGVKKETLDKYGAVSAQVAEEMASGGRKVLSVDICISDTGIAGPGGATPGKPVGLFYLGFSSKDGTSSQKHIFNGTRAENRQQAALAALQWVKQYLDSMN